MENSLPEFQGPANLMYRRMAWDGVVVEAKHRRTTKQQGGKLSQQYREIIKEQEEQEIREQEGYTRTRRKRTLFAT